MYSKKRPNRESMKRWLISGTLTTASPLHVGDGDPRRLSEIRGIQPETEADPEVATIFTNQDGRPLIPGTSIKGTLRSWARNHGIAEAMIESVFGKISLGGPVTFHDAVMNSNAAPGDTTARHWNETRGTALTPHVVIDSVTRTAQDGLLYYVEYVPTGATFQMEITGQGLTPEERATLLHVLNQAFLQNNVNSARFGSETASGWGRMEWKLDSVQTLDLDAWLTAPSKPWREALRPLRKEELSAWLDTGFAIRTNGNGKNIQVVMHLAFNGAMLINDPTRCKRGDEEGRNAIAHAALKGHDGKAYLPGSAIRGVFRAQARRIWQTMAHGGPRDLNRSGSCSRVSRRQDIRTLDSFYKLLGTTGWKAPIEIPDFKVVTEAKPHVQEFVAIDRFTGGAAAGRKFNAHGLFQPKFEGSVVIHPDRWKEAGAGDWTWLLLAFVLRDWIEGDCCLGFGASKGWGHFKATLEVTGDSVEANLLDGILNRNTRALQDTALTRWKESLDSELKGAA